MRHRVYRFLSLCFLFGALFMLAVPAFAQAKTHTVQPGETLFRIALRYGVTVEALVATNKLSDASRIVVGQQLTIPQTVTVASIDTTASNPEAAVLTSTQPLIHTVQAGQTLNLVAKQYGVTPADLVKANNLTNVDYLEVGQRLIIPGKTAPATDPVPATSPAIPPSPTLPPTTAAPMPALSGLASNLPPPTITPTAAPTALPQIATDYKMHTVQPGEGLLAIAKLYNVNWQSLAALNGITDPNRLTPGQVLKIPPIDSGATFASIPPGPIGGTFSDPEPRIGVPGKWIKVVLSEQRVYAYEEGKLVRNVLVSTGLPATPTVVGDFKVYLKYTSQLMYGPGYYLPGVPWVMYFYRDYGLHGAYWHKNWGNPMSHGCVNMPIDESKWLFNWAPVGTPVTVIW